MSAVRLLLASLALAAIPSAGANAACSPPQIQEALEESFTVFVGDVVATSDQNRIAEMRVIAVWKGPDLPEQVKVSGTNIEGSPVGADDARFTAGRRYLVIPENTREPFFATRCSATMPIRATGTLIPPAYQEVLGIDAGRAPATPAPSPTTEPPTGSLALGLAAAGIAVSAFGWLATRRPGSQRETMADTPPEEMVPEPESQPTRAHRLSMVGVASRLFARSGMTKTARYKKRRPRFWW